MPYTVKNEKLNNWVREAAALCQPDAVYWCDGSQEEYDRLMVEFWRRFPPLTSVPEIRLSSASIRSWIERRAGTAR